MNMTVAYHLSTTQDGGIPLSAFPKDTTSELAGFIFTLSFMLSAKQETMNTNFLKSLWYDPIRIQTPGLPLRRRMLFQMADAWRNKDICM